MSTQSASAAVSEVLRQPDDLLKLAAYRKKLLKEKSALDAKLSGGVKAQLDATREALLKLQASRAAVGMIKEEMMVVEKMKGETGEGEAFDRITRVSRGNPQVSASLGCRYAGPAMWKIRSSRVSGSSSVQLQVG